MTGNLHLVAGTAAVAIASAAAVAAACAAAAAVAAAAVGTTRWYECTPISLKVTVYSTVGT